MNVEENSFGYAQQGLGIFSSFTYSNLKLGQNLPTLFENVSTFEWTTT